MTLEDFQRISDVTPFLADLKPSGKYVMEDVQNIGGTPGVIKFMIDNDMFDGSQMTVTGKSWSQNLEDMNHPGLTPGQQIIRPLNDPIKPTGHLLMMYGNLCPGGGVAKITGKEGETFTGTARVYDSEPLMMEGLKNMEIKAGLAGDADTHQRDHGSRTRKRSRFADGWTIQRRNARILHRSHHAGGTGRWTDCLGEERGSNPD